MPFTMNSRGLIALVHDLIMAAFALNAALYLRLGGDYLTHASDMQYATPLFVGIAICVFSAMGLYRGVWRYASVPDLFAILRAVSLTVLLFSLALFLITRLEDFPRSTPVITWFILIMALGGPRLLYRMMKDRRLSLNSLRTSTPTLPVLLIGAGDECEVFLRTLSRNPASPYRPIGILSEKKSRLKMKIHGVNVIGLSDTLEETLVQLGQKGQKPQKIILTREDWQGDKVRALFEIAERHGLSLSRLPKLHDLQNASPDNPVTVRPVEVRDLLGRPQKNLDKTKPAAFISGKRVLITGAGGSIGSELVRQIASYGPAHIALLEASEFALYTIDMELMRRYPNLKRTPIIGNIRDRDALFRTFNDFKPDLVYHAAALKHVPLVEDNPIEGIITNAMGTRNVCDACNTHNVQAMVQISTDKAVNPTNVMGATKRIAESYAQTLDCADSSSCRFITVRFGNVLGSTGSVVPLFQKQLAEGGPLTVTHPDMNRYFMTIREAVELVLQAGVLSHNDTKTKGKICVLDMGEPVKILHLAEQMIRLAGLTPYQDIDIQITGLRPGEKLFEEIFHGDEDLVPSPIEGIFTASPRLLNLATQTDYFQRLEALRANEDPNAVYPVIKAILPEFTHTAL